ncbi:MAG: YitT family protein [Clostridia bacterium]|nr:YitT family protein [Clostridia bacterium]
MKNAVTKNIFDWVTMLVACVIYSLGIALFLSPNALAPGGMSGVAIIINKLTGLPTGMMIIILNIPLLIAGFFVVGRWFLVKTICSIAVSSTLIDLWPKIIPKYVPITEDKLLAGIAGAVLCGIGIGIIFRCGGSTGGTDIVAKLLRRVVPNIKTGSIFLIVDSVIIIASVFATKHLENALYAGISLFLTSFIIDKVLYGSDEAKLLIIMSSDPDKVAQALLTDIDAGVTFANGSGAYTGKETKIIFCVVKKQLFHKAKRLVCEVDPASFIIVSNASEIFGEGYKAHNGEEL